MRRVFIIIGFILCALTAWSQQVLLQGWYWDYPKYGDGYSWADTLNQQASELADAGFTHIWFPPHAIASFGNTSNGYDPKDLFIGNQASGLGSRTALNDMLQSFQQEGLAPVADMIYNHRDGGFPETNLAVEGWIQNLTFAKVDAGDQPYPSDRFRNLLPLGGASGNNSGDYYFKISSASQHPAFHNKPYKVYVQTSKKGFQNLAPLNESEPNGGGDCSEPSNDIFVGVDMLATVDGIGCTVDEFKLTLDSSDFNVSGDTLQIYLTNQNGDYSDHRIYFIWNASASMNVESQLIYETYTDFTNCASGRGGMTAANFRPNGNPTCLCGDQDGMIFFYDYDHSVPSTRDTLIAYTEWNYDSLGVRGIRMDAIKHFPASFVSDMLNYMHAQGKDFSMVVGEWFSTNTGELNGWLTDVYNGLDTGTANALDPKIFDFNLRESLRQACDAFGYDVRNVFNSGLRDASGTSGFNIVTFVNNHDFRDTSGFNALVRQDPLLAYAYIITNNQLGVPAIYYPDYYNFYDSTINPIYSVARSNTNNLKRDIDLLIQVLQTYINGASSVDYLSRFSTPYFQNFYSGFPSTSLIYQLSNSNFGEDVVVAINFAGDTLDLDQEINIANINPGDTLIDVLGRSDSLQLHVSGGNTIRFQIPPRSFSVFVKNGSLLDPCALDVLELSGALASGIYKASDDILVSGTIQAGKDVTLQAGQQIELKPVFEVELGSVLDAIIEDCPN